MGLMGHDQRNDMHAMGILEEREKGRRVYLVTVAEHFLTWGREMNIQLHEVQRS